MGGFSLIYGIVRSDEVLEDDKEFEVVADELDG